MTRKKKARKVGSEGPAQYNQRSLKKEDLAALARKRSARSKGLKAGSRHSDANQQQQVQIKKEQDPRLGSKKSIPLVVESMPHPKSAVAKKARKINAKQELELLENDAQLNALLDRLDNGEKLGSGLQSYVDEKLDKIEMLMQQLGLLDDQDEEPLELTDGHKSKNKKRSDDDLLNEFESFKFDQE